MKRLGNHRKKITVALLLLLAALVLFVRDRPIARAAPHALAVPPAPATVSPVRACWAEMGRNEAFGQVATAGVTHLSTWEVTVAGLVVRHPKGDLVVDVGNSSAFAKEIAEYTYLERKWLELLPGSNRIVATAPEALRALGVRTDALTVVVSHAHADHMGGLVDLPEARVLMPEEELAFSRGHAGDHSVHVVPAHARALDGRTSALVFAPRPYETFDESADIFGDGSVVVVKLFGHTPGSVGVFVNVSPAVRMFHVGDAVNLVEAVERRLTKSVVMASTDVSHAGADATVARIAQLHEAEPGIAILPAHDRAAWARVFGGPGRCVGP
jgi:N-acyl homoserine lactone hydrolase